MKKFFISSHAYVLSMRIAWLMGMVLVFIKHTIPCSDDMQRQLSEGAILCIIFFVIYGLLAVYQSIKHPTEKDS